MRAGASPAKGMWRGTAARAIMAFLAAVLIATAFPAPPAPAHDYTLGAIRIGHLWSPPAQDGGTFVYGPFLNGGSAADTLVSATTEAAGEVRFCAGPQADGGCRASIALEPGKPYAMAPWRTAVRLTGLTRPLAEGDSFSLTLTFEKAGEITVDIVVETSAGH